MRVEQTCTHPRAQNASSGSGAGTLLFARPQIANSATGAFLTLSAIVIVGCSKVEAPKQPPLPVAWCESSAGCQRQTVAFYFYLSWPNGDSLAIVVPFLKSRPGDRDSRPARSVYVSEREGVIYRDRERLLDFPPADSRCYILGADWRLHDSGRSAEWLCSAYRLDRTGLSDAAVEEKPGAGRGKVILPQEIREQEEFERQFAAHAFGADTDYSDPWGFGSNPWGFETTAHNEGAGSRFVVPVSEALTIGDVQGEGIGMGLVVPLNPNWPDGFDFHQKWNLRSLQERPESWKSVHPREN